MPLSLPTFEFGFCLPARGVRSTQFQVSATFHFSHLRFLLAHIPLTHGVASAKSRPRGVRA